MLTRVVIELVVEGHDDDVSDAVEALLDAGLLQDAVNELESDGNRFRVVSAAMTSCEEVMPATPVTHGRVIVSDTSYSHVTRRRG